jgi:hypothetical protein
MNTIETLIREHGGLVAVSRNYLRIENPPFMRLVVEVVAGPFRSGSYEVSVAHYGEQNGDAMRDPEVTFLLVPSDSEWVWTPLTFLNDYIGTHQIVAQYNADGEIEQPRPFLIKQLTAFCRQWDANLKEQGFLEAYRARLAR